MYKEVTAEYWRKYLGLSENYQVEAVLIYGAFGGQPHVEKFLLMLKTFGIPGELTRIGLLGNVFEFKYKNRNYWFIVAYGTTVLSENLHIVSMFGSKKNIHIGSCGGLYKEANAADFIIPTFSYGNESTTRMYERQNETNEHFSNKELSKKLRDRINSSFTIHEGPVISIQAMLAETAEDVQKWSEAGYFGVEMETATIFAMSNHFHIPSAAIVYVHDNLIKGQIVGDERHIQEKDLRDKTKDEIYRVAVSELLDLP